MPECSSRKAGVPSTRKGKTRFYQFHNLYLLFIKWQIPVICVRLSQFTSVLGLRLGCVRALRFGRDRLLGPNGVLHIHALKPSLCDC